MQKISPHLWFDSQACGWLKDRFGVSWQVVPGGFEEMMLDPDQAKVDRLTEAVLKMKEFDLAELERALTGG